VTVTDVEVVETVGVVVVAVLVDAVDEVVRVVEEVVEVVVVVLEPEEVYLKVIVPLAPFESTADMTYVPVAHDAEPPTEVAYEKVPEAVTASVEESTNVEELWSSTSMKT